MTFRLTIPVAALAMVAALTAAAQPLQYTGYLETLDGEPADGTHTVIFRLWEDETSRLIGDLACEFQVDTVIEDGFFSLPLTPECRTAAGESGPLWLELEVLFGSVPEVFPRQQLGGVPAAIRAERAGDFAVEGTLDLGLETVFGTVTATTIGVLLIVPCPDGWNVLGGGCGSGHPLSSTGPSDSPVGWGCAVPNPGHESVSINGYAICADVRDRDAAE